MQIRIGIPIPATKGGHQPPSPGFEYPNASFCQDDGDQTPVITGTQGGVFSVSPSISGFNTTTGTIPGNSPAGTYNVTYSVQGLTETDQIVITADFETTFTYPNGENRFTILPTQTSNPSSGIYSFVTNPGNLTINATTGAIDLSAATAGQSYTVQYLPNNVCANPTQASFTVVQAFQSFEFTIQVNAGDTFTFPGSGSYNINWGLNNNNNLTNFVGQGNTFGAPAYTGSATSPTYTNGGTYTIQVGMYGDTLSRILFNGGLGTGVDATKVRDLIKWGEFQYGSFEAAFKGCANLEMKCTDTPDLSNCTNFNQAFRQCSLMTGTVSGTNWNWNFSSNLTTFNSMFFRCPNFNGNISSWDTSMVNYMGYMFDCSGTSSGSFNQDLSSWDVSKVTSLVATFRNQGSFNSDISNWKTDQLVDLSYTFFGATSFNRDINTKSVTYGGSTYPAWKIDKVTTLQKTFEGATSFNTSVSNWDTSSVLNLASTFKNTPFNNPVNTTSVTVSGVGTYNAWDVSSVTNMGDGAYNNGPFANCTSFNQPLNNWNTGSVQSFYSIFDGCSSFNQDISSWNTSTATSMTRMFRNATSFDQDISSWDINQVSSFLQFMQGATLSTTNYDAVLTAWDAQGAMSYSGTVDFGNSVPSCDNAASNGAFAARASLITKWGGISDKFSQNNTCQPLAGFNYTSNAYCNNGSDVTPTITGTIDQTLPLGGTISDFWSAVVAILPLKLTVRIPAGGGSFDVGKIKAGGTNFTVNWGDGTIQNNLSKPPPPSETVTHTYTGTGSQVDYTVQINDTADSGIITHVRFDDSTTEDKIYDVTQWGTTPWTSFQNFLRVQSANIPADVTATDTPNLSNCTAMHGMFQGCTSLVNANNSMLNWITGNVANMDSMFKGATSFNKNLSGWDITGLSTAEYIFQGGGLNTANYTDTIVGWAVQVYNNSAQPASVNMSGIPASGVFDGNRTTDNASGQAYSTKYSNWPSGWSNAQAAYDYLTSTLSWTISAS